LDFRHPWMRERRVEGAHQEFFGLCPECVYSTETD
jgi:hypothetical protein